MGQPVDDAAELNLSPIYTLLHIPTRGNILILQRPGVVGRGGAGHYSTSPRARPR